MTQQRKTQLLDFLSEWVRPVLAPLVVGLLSAWGTASVALARLDERINAMEHRMNTIESRVVSAEQIRINNGERIARIEAKIDILLGMRR